MESPYGRPSACELIADVIDEHYESIRADTLSREFRCGLSLEMKIYDVLNRAQYLTKSASEPYELCCGRKSKWEPCENG